MPTTISRSFESVDDYRHYETSYISIVSYNQAFLKLLTYAFDKLLKLSWSFCIKLLHESLIRCKSFRNDTGFQQGFANSLAKKSKSEKRIEKKMKEESISSPAA